MRILHTSDWHFGATLRGASREPEHRMFVDWLVAHAADNDIEVVIIAGDVFEYAQASAEAQRLYYEALARLVGEGGVREIVVVGGNHDSPTRLDAPADLLGALRVHVVGGWSPDRDDLVIPIRGSGGAVELSVLAVPYIHEYRLGVRMTGATDIEVAQQLRGAIRELYTGLTDRALKAHPDVPVLATAHLTCSGARPEDYGTRIHLIDSLGALPPELFDERIGYVALGHVHRMFSPDEGRVWYCGTPVALNRAESRSPRYVLELEVQDGGFTEPVPVRVPDFRQIHEIRGDRSTVIDRLRSLTWSEPLPPLVFARVAVDSYQTDLAEMLAQATPRGAQLVAVEQEAPYDPMASDNDVLSTGLAELSPEEVFVRLYRLKNQREPSDAVLRAFRSLAPESAPHTSAPAAQSAPEQQTLVLLNPGGER